MPFSEDDLRSALKRKDPGAGFTQRVMARIEQDTTRVASPKSKLLPKLLALRLRPTLAGALIAILLLAGGLLGYRQHLLNQARLVREKQAREQAILAVRITTQKLNRVLHRVSQSAVTESKIRREQL